jgi:hypothetical protein
MVRSDQNMEKREIEIGFLSGFWVYMVDKNGFVLCSFGFVKFNPLVTEPVWLVDYVACHALPFTNYKCMDVKIATLNDAILRELCNF